MKRILIGFLLAYPILFFVLLAINFKDTPGSLATILMGATLFALWVLIGGTIQNYFLKNYRYRFEKVRTAPVRYFVLSAILLACTEEAVAVLITNLAPVYGVHIGEAYITASTNYFNTIFLHSVIVFIPMFFMLGTILKRYDISPFKAFILFGLVGVVAESTFAGLQALLNAPFWILVYGLMVYLPAHAFTHTARKEVPMFLYPILIVLIALSAIFTAWIPAILNVPKTEFPAALAQ